MKYRNILCCIIFLSEILFTVSAVAEEKDKSRPMQPPPEAVSNAPVELQNPEHLASVNGQAMPDAARASVIYLKDIPQYSRANWNGVEQVHVQGEMLLDLEGEGGTFIDTKQNTAHQRVPESEPPTADDANSNIDAPSNVTANIPGDFGKQWKALSNTGWSPPDTIAAVGPKHVVEGVNSGFAVYTKAGTAIQGYTTFDSFMHKPSGFQGSMFDPRVVYDPIHQRFLMLILGKDDINTKSYVWIGVSRTSDPTDGWCRYRWDVTDTTGTSTAWMDYAALGYDSWGVYFTGNYFYFTGGYRGAYLQTVNVDIFSDNCSGATNGWAWRDLKWPDNSQAFTLQPALPHTINSDQQTFFVNTHFSSGNKAVLWKLSGDRTSSPTLTRSEITTTTSYNAIGNNVVQQGSSVRIDGGDARVMNAIYADKRVFYAHTSDVNNDGDEAGWLTVKLNTDNNSEDWHHLLWATDHYYIYPAITLEGVSNNGALALFGSWSNSGRYVSGVFKMYVNQPTDSTGPFLFFDSGNGVYDNVFGGRNRWGDYSGASYDWTCGFAWGAVETADTNNNWQTVISARAFDDEDVSCLDDEVIQDSSSFFILPVPGGASAILNL